MKFSLRFNNDLPVSDYLRYARAAEAAGFDQFWVSNDLLLRSAPVILTAIAGATERIEIGSCILNPYTINAAEIAMFAATLDEYSGGRFNLGLSAGAADFLRWLGMEQPLPRTTTIEAARAINQLTAGKNAAMKGRALRWTDEAWLRFESARRVPIYLGAMSPRMLEEIGALADGGLPLLFPPEHFATVLPHIQRGLARAGRSLTDIDLAACIWCSVSDDQAAAEAMLADKIAYYGHAMSPLILAQLGLTRADFEADSSSAACGGGRGGSAGNVDAGHAANRHCGQGAGHAAAPGATGGAGRAAYQFRSALGSGHPVGQSSR